MVNDYYNNGQMRHAEPYKVKRGRLAPLMTEEEKQKAFDTLRKIIKKI